MVERKHLGADIGRGFPKIVGADGYRDKFPADVGPAHDVRLKNELRPTDIVLRTTTGTWWIGDIAREQSYGSGRMMTSSKVHTDTKLLCTAAVARAAEDGDDFELTVGVPVADHKPQTKQELVQLLTGMYLVELNGVTKRFSISAVRVAVEGPSAYVAVCAGRPGTQRFIDIGSRTVNFGTITDGRYIDRESGTLDYGCDTVNTDHQSFARLIAADLSRTWRDFNAETYLLGGGAIRCSEGLRQHFPRMQCVPDPQFTNAKAFYLIGEAARNRA